MTARVLVLIVVLGVASNAGADVIYSYVGSTYTDILDSPRPAGTFDTSMRVAGSFTLADALAPNMSSTDISALVTSFSFSNGRHTLTNLDPLVSFAVFSVTTNALGGIESWLISIQQLEALGALGTDIIIQTTNDPDSGFPVEDLGELDVCSEFDPPGICHTLADVATVGGAAGTWTTTTPTDVPEPATLGMCALGFWAVRRRARRVR